MPDLIRDFRATIAVALLAIVLVAGFGVWAAGEMGAAHAETERATAGLYQCVTGWQGSVTNLHILNERLSWWEHRPGGGE